MARTTRPLSWSNCWPGRLEAFSDGVFAIAITLLVLDLAVQPGWEIDPLGALLELWPQYLAYIVKFRDDRGCVDRSCWYPLPASRRLDRGED